MATYIYTTLNFLFPSLQLMLLGYLDLIDNESHCMMDKNQFKYNYFKEPFAQPPNVSSGRPCERTVKPNLYKKEH